MDRRGSLSASACVKHVLFMVYLLGSARCSGTDPSCACTKIPPRSLTQNSTLACFQINQTFRYTCSDGYRRKAGTSNLIRCVSTNTWSSPSLQCIVISPDPPQTTPQPKQTFTTSTVTQSGDLSSTVGPETERPELTSAVPFPEQTSARYRSLILRSCVCPDCKRAAVDTPAGCTGRPLMTSALPQTSSSTPSASPGSSTAPLTPEKFHSTTSSRSSPTTTTLRSSYSSETTPPSRAFINGTSSTSTQVIAPVTVGVFVLAAVGLVWFLCRWKSRQGPQRKSRERPLSQEETFPMRQKEDMT